MKTEPYHRTVLQSSITEQYHRTALQSTARYTDWGDTMKIIHCADLHLDSNMKTHLDADKAKERRNELLVTWKNMVRYAKEEDVSAILIAGDLFDKKVISAAARNAVTEAIVSNPEITFYYVSGNHEKDSFLSSLLEIPQNLKTFGDNWTQYRLGNKTVLSGIELGAMNPSETAAALPVLAADEFNIVLMHGQESETGTRDKTELIALRDYRNRSIDYMALGHVHEYKCEKLDARGVYCYSGCLEGRGFDECGEHGFVLLEIDEESRSAHASFVPFAGRTLHVVPVDITGCHTSGQAAERVNAAAASKRINRKDMVRFVLTGTYEPDDDIDEHFVTISLNLPYYFFKVVDESVLHVDYNDYAADASLKGEFVRLVMADETLSDEDKAQVVKCGIEALRGEK